jgi:hypothetical protein
VVDKIGKGKKRERQKKKSNDFTWIMALEDWFLSGCSCMESILFHHWVKALQPGSALNL